MSSSSEVGKTGRGHEPDASKVETLRALELSTALQLAALVESSEDAVIVLSLDGLIASWSEGAERLFGYSRTEVVGQRVGMLSPDGLGQESAQLVAEILAGGEIQRLRTERVAKDGTVFPVSLVISAITDASGAMVGVAGIVRDLSTQRDAEGRLQASDERYRSVVDALNDGVVLQDADGQTVAVNRSAAEIIGRPVSELLGDDAWLGDSTLESIVRLVHEDGSPFLYDERPAMVSLRTGVKQTDVVMGAERRDGSMSWLSINSSPLRHPGEERPYAVVSSISDVTALRRTIAELQAARFEDLERLALAAEYRDDDTHRHTERVAAMAQRLARRLALNGGLVSTLRRAAPLHDVGKIGIPDSILLKPGPLSVGEFEEMKTHTTIGARILGDSRYPILSLGREIALTHHERWDGTGYPSGLRGEAIPISGRIVAVADVFDAITHARPYKEALPVQYAISEITGGSGTQFDPAAVDAFLAVRGAEPDPTGRRSRSPVAARRSADGPNDPQ